LFQIEGGPLFAAGATLIVKGVTLQNGYVKFSGAVAVGLGGSATFSSCSFVKNTAGNTGGAVSVGGGSANFSSCSFVKNFTRQIHIKAYGPGRCLPALLSGVTPPPRYPYITIK
jgi:hypothetical protein